MEKRKFHYDTLSVHGGYEPDDVTLSRAVPIYQTTAYKFRSCDHAARLFELKEGGNIYTRLMNPTTNVLEARVAAMEGGVGALSVSSGLSAQLIALTAILKKGDNLVSSPFVYGGTFNQFKVTFANFGIECRFAASDDGASIEPLIDANTKAIYVETIGNPSFSIPDFESVAAVAKRHDLPLIVDNTFGACGYLCRPLDLGADIVVESATKWIGGHGSAMGGIIVDGGTYNWGNGKYPQFTEPSAGYHGMKFWEVFGNQAFIMRCRVEGLRDLGCCSSPFDSFLLIQGVETMSVRVQKECDTTMALARYFHDHPMVEEVIYPGLPGDPFYDRACKYLQNGSGAVFGMKLKGSKEKTVRFIESLQLITHLTNVGDVRTIITHPASTTHQQLSDEEQLRGGITPTLLRISVGLEHVDDLIWDFEQALEQIK